MANGQTGRNAGVASEFRNSTSQKVPKPHSNPIAGASTPPAASFLSPYRKCLGREKPATVQPLCASALPMKANDKGGFGRERAPM